jgi:hypothetical protein
MRKLLVSESMTLDGVMQAPGGKDEDRDGGSECGRRKDQHHVPVVFASAIRGPRDL